MISDLQRRIIRRIQGGLPLSERPFLAAAEEIGITEGELLAQIAEWKEDGTIRRFGAILKHADAGYAANAMGAWNVPDEDAERFGRTASSHKSVSHCYLRPRFEGFPYNLYTMIHGRSREECEVVAGTISEQTGVADYELLYTTAEYKKTSPVYFADDEESR
ncbi:MAG: Lrp/AsnC family transcriptional regulator [Armatimonadetes bacterium]|nr:Lrp/AsnC family transcriptional regulator [Armatimonadota bacterium]